MALRSQEGSLLPAILVLTLAFNVSSTLASPRIGNKIKSVTFLSPELVLEPGSVENRFYYNIDFPRGHVGLKSLRAEVIDGAGKPIPLHETYLHHWVVAKYYQRQDMADNNGDQKIQQADCIFGGNSGICQGTILRQYFGLGSETRKTDTHIPDPYAIEIGNPAEIPEGYEEKWMLNVHAIDTRGAVDKLGCTECRCDLYNVTVDEYGQPLRPDYTGGLSCCYDQTRCRVQKGYGGVRRSLYLRYTVEWVDWDCGFIPVKVFIFDVTDTGKRLDVSAGPENGCQDGHVICNSEPIYGEGKDAGDEAGYVVGMSTCYPEPGSIQITAGENLVLESNYSSTQKHTGVMGVFYILVADRTPNPMNFLHSPINIHEKIKVSKSTLAVVSLLGLAIVGAGLRHRLKKRREEEGYEPIMA